MCHWIEVILDVLHKRIYRTDGVHLQERVRVAQTIQVYLRIWAFLAISLTFKTIL
jgi:hypothetical protein